MPPPRPRRRRSSRLSPALLAALTAATTAALPSIGRAAPAPAPPLAADADALTRALPAGAAVERLWSDYALLAPPADAPADPALDTDPRYKKRLTRAVYLYAPREPRRPRAAGATATPGGGLSLAVTLHHEPAQRERALRCARLAARLLRLHHDNFVQPAAFGRDEPAADVWLVPGPAPGGAGIGGETHGSQVYIWAADDETRRTPLEWVRTFVHEWGHLTLPAARGFTAPETDASGYLGERLYFKWLYFEFLRSYRPFPGPDPDDGVRAEDVSLYNRRQVEPLIARWLAPNGGPASPLLDRRDAAAMDYYIGAALAADRTLGGPLLHRALFTVLDATPRALIAALARAAAARPSLNVLLPAWVPFAPGRYVPSVRRTDAIPTDPGGVVFGAGGPTSPLGRAVRIPAPGGWRRLTSKTGESDRIQLRRAGSEKP